MQVYVNVDMCVCMKVCFVYSGMHAVTCVCVGMSVYKGICAGVCMCVCRYEYACRCMCIWR